MRGERGEKVVTAGASQARGQHFESVARVRHRYLTNTLIRVWRV